MKERDKTVACQSRNASIWTMSDNLRLQTKNSQISQLHAWILFPLASAFSGKSHHTNCLLTANMVDSQKSRHNNNLALQFVIWAHWYQTHCWADSPYCMLQLSSKGASYCGAATGNALHLSDSASNGLFAPPKLIFHVWLPEQPGYNELLDKEVRAAVHTPPT